MAVVLLFLLVWSQNAQAASFPCGQAATCTEQIICRIPSLSSMDDQMSDLFSKVLQNDIGNTSKLMSDQAGWLRKRDGCGCNANCIGGEYSMRIDLFRRILSLPSPPSSSAPLLLDDLVWSSWVIGSESNCRDTAKRYSVTADEQTMTWTTVYGHDVESVIESNQTRISTVTLRSVRNSGRAEPIGKRWIYERIGAQVKVTQEGGAVFVLSRCP